VRRIIEDGHELALSVLHEHMDELHRISQILIERETIDSANAREPSPAFAMQKVEGSSPFHPLRERPRNRGLFSFSLPHPQRIDIAAGARRTPVCWCQPSPFASAPNESYEGIPEQSAVW
jgi:hypothetical protein